MPFCNNCGNEIVENVKFCNACGTKIASVNTEVNSSGNDKQEKVFFKYNGARRELIISSELIKCTYKKYLFYNERISIIPRNINSFECKSFTGIRILGGILVAMSILIWVFAAKINFGIGEHGYFEAKEVSLVFIISVAFFVIGLPRIFLKPKIEISSGVKNYLLPISIFGSKDELLNAIQSAVSYKR